MAQKHPGLSSSPLRLFAFSLLCGWTSLSIAEAPPEVETPELAVVKTLADLLRQPVIELPGGGQVQLGIETDTAPAGAGVMVYVLAQHPEPPRQMKRQVSPARQDAGPVSIEVRRADRPEVLRALLSFEASLLKTQEWDDQTHRLYAQVAGLPPDADAWDVLLFPRDAEPDARPLAKVSVQRAAATFHPWMPFGGDLPRGQVRFQKPDEGDPDFTATLTIGQGAALPRLDGDLPLMRLKLTDGQAQQLRIEWSADGRQPRHSVHQVRLDAALPAAIPAEPDESLRLQIHENSLLLRSETPITLKWPTEYLLARWWINGQPYQPPPVEKVPAMLQTMGRQGHSLRINLVDVPSALGAKPGDLIEVQLMHTPAGWEWSGLSMMTERLLAVSEQITPPRLTPRKAWRVGEDGALHPASDGEN